MLAGCCAGFICFLVFVAVAAAISFGPVALKVTMDKLEELEGSILPYAYCSDYVVDQGPSNSVCCILNTKSPDCQIYQYCQGEKVSTQRTIEHWKVAGIVGVAADGLLLLCIVCLCLGNCRFFGCLHRMTKGCLKCSEGSCMWCFAGGRMFCKLCPTFAWTARDER